MSSMMAMNPAGLKGLGEDGELENVSGTPSGLFLRYWSESKYSGPKMSTLKTVIMGAVFRGRSDGDCPAKLASFEARNLRDLRKKVKTWFLKHYQTPG